MYKLLLVLTLAGACHGRFVKMREVCRSQSGLGFCTQSDFCCRTLGGEIADQSVPAATQSRNIAMLLARSSQSLGEQGCSYEGICCVLPVPEDNDCGSCGLKGNGDLDKATTPSPMTMMLRRSTTTTEPPAKKITPRIVGGEDAEPNEWCWHVALLNRTGLIGGGALIARNWVVTACHNIAGLFLDEFIVALNLHSFVHNKELEPEVYYSQATNVIVHPLFNPANFDNNICLLRIPDAPCNRDGVCTICLPEGPKEFPTTTTPPPLSTSTTTQSPEASTFTTTTSDYGSVESGLSINWRPTDTLVAIQNEIRRANMMNMNQMNNNNMMIDSNGNSVPVNQFANLVCYVTGFGRNGLSAVSETLQESPHQIITNEQCELEFELLNVPASKIRRPANNSFCTRGLGNSAATCVGDGGGPLVCQSPNDHVWELCGIIQLGLNMCGEGLDNGPTIHVNVGEYRDWIINQIINNVPARGENRRKEYRVLECGESLGSPCPMKLDMH